MASSVSKNIKLIDEMDGEVHSVFEKAVNIDIGKTMVSLLSPAVGNNPCGIVLNVGDDFSFDGIGLYPGQRVRFTGGVVRIEAAEEIDLDGASCWDGSLGDGLSDMRPDILRGNVSLLKDRLLRYSGYGLADLAFGPAAGENLYTAYMRPRLEGILSGLKAGDNHVLTLAVRELVGFGPGLTPSADDFLTGFLGASYLLKGEGIVHILRDAVKRNLGRTTGISSIMLSYAAEGEFNEFLKDLIIGLASSEDTDCIMRLFLREAGIGATSGIDAVSGLVWGLEFFMREDDDEGFNSQEKHLL